MNWYETLDWLDKFFLRPIEGTPYERISNRGLLIVIIWGVIIYLICLWFIRKEER